MPIFDLAALAARLLTPLAGVIVFGWSAPAMLLLYFADTLASIAVICAGLLAAMYPPEDGESIAARINAHAGVVGGGVLIAAMFAIPLGVPVLFMLGDSTLRAALADPTLRSGLVAQGAFALWSYAALYRALQTATPEALGLKRRFALAFLRWVAMIVVGTTGVALLFGRFGPLLLVAVYTAISFVVEVAPDRFLRVFGPGTAAFVDADPSAAKPGPAGTAPDAPAGRRAKRRRRR